MGTHSYAPFGAWSFGRPERNVLNTIAAKQAESEETHVVTSHLVSGMSSPARPVGLVLLYTRLWAPHRRLLPATTRLRRGIVRAHA